MINKFINPYRKVNSVIKTIPRNYIRHSFREEYERLAWERVTKYLDYGNVEELYNVDEIDKLYYKASKKRGW